jgi:hypothetical protein
VVEADRDAELPVIAARAQRELSSAGEAVPRVEVYPVGVQPPAYQTAARGAGALLWACRPNPGARVARVFDDVNAGVGSMRPGHPRIGSPERERLLLYLSAGEPLLATPALDADVVAPGLGDVVPGSFRTDGYWIWSDAAGYYLQRHGLAPDPGLLAHIRARDYAIPEIDGVTLQWASAALRRFLREAGRASAPRARSVAECHLYMRLHPCSCGEAGFPWTSHETSPADSGDLSVYKGSCPRCGTARRFEFLVDSPGVAPPAFGGPEPSRIIGPEEFHKLSQQAAAVARDGDRADGHEAALDAVASVEEVLKFIPPGADAVPAKALPHGNPADYTRQRLEALRDAYRDLLWAHSRDLS